MPNPLPDDWHGRFRGALHTASAACAPYAVDASPFQVVPRAVACPVDADDLAAIVRYAGEHAIPLTLRGGGSGLAGEALGAGIVVDCSVHLRAILATTEDTVTVQPGVSLTTLNRHLAAFGRRLGPDPASANVCTIGGMLATNASGSTVKRHGTMRDAVVSLAGFWDDASPFTLPVPVSQRTTELIAGLASIRERFPSYRPRTAFDRVGYAIHGDLMRLLVGSEGTLAVFSEATLRTIPLPGGESAVLFGFARWEDALRAGEILRAGPAVSADLFDRRFLSLLRSDASLVPADTEATLLVSFEEASPEAARDVALRTIERLGAWAFPGIDVESLATLRSWRGGVGRALGANVRGTRPTAFVEDIGVPLDRFDALLQRIRDTLRDREMPATILAHLLTGQIHVRPFVNLADPAEHSRMWALADALYDEVLAAGGTISTQHGIGLARTPWIEQQLGPATATMREVKRLFDPRGILNPGKIVGPDPSRPAWPMRTTPTEVVPLFVEQPVTACNGCGECRTTSTGRMCPAFRATPTELAAPRAQAELLRHVITEIGYGRTPNAQDVRTIAEACIHCRQCVSECPSNVDVHSIVTEVKARLHADHAFGREDGFFARLDTASKWASRFAFTTNLLLGSRVARWLLEKAFGLSRKRRLPKFALRSFAKRARRRGLTQRHPANNRPRLAYYTDRFADHHDPSLAEAVVAVLEHHGYEVHVPAGQRGSGMGALHQGDLDTARDMIRANIRVLADCVREGYRIVCSEPSAVMMLTQDAPRLLPDMPDVKLVADHVVELMALLGEHQANGSFQMDLGAIRVAVGHHVPCHRRALGSDGPTFDILSLIPGLRLFRMSDSCSGMAGTFGLHARNFERSLAMGRPMLDDFARPRVLFGTTECSSCRMQMEQAAGKRVLHPIQFLALAYGLMPELGERLARP